MTKRLTQEEFEEKANKIHNGKYKYGEYINNHSKITIICPLHGEFTQKPNKHLNGQGCPECGKIMKSLKHNENARKTFKDRANKIHNFKYEYGEYTKASLPIDIYCPIHGKFSMKAYAHLSGQGCPLCSGRGHRNNETFIKQSKLIHRDLYDYSRVNYVAHNIVVTIICPKHGEFCQTPNAHLQGHGCPKCKSSKLEIDIRNFLTDKSIEFIEQYHPQWMGLQSLDFYLPDYKVGIECQGKQHFEDGCTFGGNETLDMILARDKRKLQKCNDNGVRLLYYSNLRIDYPYKVFEDKDKLLEAIQSD